MLAAAFRLPFQNRLPSRRAVTAGLTEGYFREIYHITQKISPDPLHRLTTVLLPFQGRLIFIQALTFVHRLPFRGAVTVGD